MRDKVEHFLVLLRSFTCEYVSTEFELFSTVQKHSQRLIIAIFCSRLWIFITKGTQMPEEQQVALFNERLFKSKVKFSQSQVIKASTILLVTVLG